MEGPATLEIEGDRRLLHSALSNLLRNAIKFTPAGGRVTLRAMQVATRPGHGCTFGFDVPLA